MQSYSLKMYVKFNQKFNIATDTIIDIQVNAKNLHSAINKAQKKLQKNYCLSYDSSNCLEHYVVGYF